MNLNVDGIRGTYECPGEAELQAQIRRQIEQLLGIRAELLHPQRVPDSAAQYGGENNASERSGTAKDFHRSLQRRVA